MIRLAWSHAPDPLRVAFPLWIAGAVGIVAGGLVAAAVAHAPSQPWVWLAAYLVLVVGVTQVLLAAGQKGLVGDRVRRRTIGLECLLFNLGNLAVMVGTLRPHIATVAIGSVLIALALGVFWGVTRDAADPRGRWVYRLLLLFVLISALVGLMLAASAPAG